jgi:3-methyladenine DNA glycosylase Mpg
MQDNPLIVNSLDPTEFHSIAEKIINSCQLSVNGTNFWISEIEFYLHSPKHPDPCVHCNEDQLLKFSFYFHRSGKSKTSGYKGGTFKGVDLTFGDGEIYFGILIRTIENENEIVEGPCRVVNKILELYEVKSISELTHDTNLNIYQNHRNLVLISATRNEKIYMGTRIGLGDKEYSDKIYRYATNKVKKEKKKLIVCS